MKLMIVAGEASGDVYGARLAERLRLLCPGVELFGIGGTMMQAAGVRLLFNPTALSVVGLAEAVRSVAVLRRVLTRAVEALGREAPDCLVLIDFPEFNMRLAEAARRYGVKAVYLFAPTAWAWRRGRASKVARAVTKVASVFPLEADVYRKAGASVEFVGHPLLDLVEPAQPGDREAARKELGLESPRVAGILPGSRGQEVRLLLTPLLDAAARIARARPDVGFVLPLAHTVSEEEVRARVTASGAAVRVVSGQAQLCMVAADVLMMASGTATLEAAIIGRPMVVVYRTSSSTWALGKLLVTIPYISWPNILAGRQIVPELLQAEASGARIAQETMRILDDPSVAGRMVEDLAEARSALGSRGALDRTARLVAKVAGA